ncbi:universal stress protein [Allonocardiopsis opalescens]|nr:universal stress protein [Allonocardiopsis opalescens]
MEGTRSGGEAEGGPTAGAVTVGVDGSPASGHALDWAAEEARLRGARLHVVHALALPLLAAAPFAGPRTLPPTERMAEHAAEVVDGALRRAAAVAPGVVTESSVSPQSASAALLELAEHSALVVVGSRGLGAFASMLVGSVSIRMAAHSPCPVVVVPPPPEGEPPRERRGRVVAGVHGGEHDADLLRFAYAESRRRGAELVLLHAWRLPVAVDPMMLAVPSIDMDPEVLTARVREYVEEGMEPFRAEFADVPTEIRVEQAEASRALVEAAEQADLLVVGSRARGNLRGLVLGSVSQFALRHAPCPVAVLRRHGDGPPPGPQRLGGAGARPAG